LSWLIRYPATALVTTDAFVRNIATRYPKARGVDPRQFYNPAPLEQLAKEGFIKELYPR
jgi:hypothetical protein